MRLSAPIPRLKQRARQLARAEHIPLHEALNRLARSEGFASWSLLAARAAADRAPAAVALSGLAEGDLFLLGARPGHGKTLLALRLLLEAARAGRRAAFFTLEYTEAETRQRLRALGGDAGSLDIVASDAISADYVIGHLAGAPRGTLAIIDYLQILDQQRSKPALAEQVRALSDFARGSGVVLGFIAQIDRSYDPARQSVPDLADLRLPNPVDLRLFSKACFLHNGESRFQAMA